MISATPLSERPRERCLEKGARVLSLRECVAVVLGSGPPGVGCLGLASRVLEGMAGGSAENAEAAFFAAFDSAGDSYLREIPGLGEAGRARLLAAFELGRRYGLHRREPVSSGGRSRLEGLALSRVRAELRCEPQEWLGFVPLFRSGKLGELCLVERGVRTHVNVDPQELFARVLALRPAGFFLFHNHPSGNLQASADDRELTRSVDHVARQLGVRLLGHWIVTPSGTSAVEEYGMTGAE